MLAQLAQSPAWRSYTYVCLACRHQRLLATRRDQPKLHVEQTPAPVDTWFDGLNDISETYVTPPSKKSERRKEDESKEKEGLIRKCVGRDSIPTGHIFNPDAVLGGIHRALDEEWTKSEIGRAQALHFAKRQATLHGTPQQQDADNEEKVSSSGHTSIESPSSYIHEQEASNGWHQDTAQQKDSGQVGAGAAERPKNLAMGLETPLLSKPLHGLTRSQRVSRARALKTGMPEIRRRLLHRRLREAQASGASYASLKQIALSRGASEQYLRAILDVEETRREERFDQVKLAKGELKAEECHGKSASNDAIDTHRQNFSFDKILVEAAKRKQDAIGGSIRGEESESNGSAPKPLQMRNPSPSTSRNDVETVDTSFDCNGKRDAFKGLPGLDLVNPPAIHDRPVPLVERFRKAMRESDSKRPPQTPGLGNRELRKVAVKVFEQSTIEEQIQRQIRVEVQKRLPALVKRGVLDLLQQEKDEAKVETKTQVLVSGHSASKQESRAWQQDHLSSSSAPTKQADGATTAKSKPGRPGKDSSPTKETDTIPAISHRTQMTPALNNLVQKLAQKKMTPIHKAQVEDWSQFEAQQRVEAPQQVEALQIFEAQDQPQQQQTTDTQDHLKMEVEIVDQVETQKHVKSAHMQTLEEAQQQLLERAQDDEPGEPHKRFSALHLPGMTGQGSLITARTATFARWVPVAKIRTYSTQSASPAQPVESTKKARQKPPAKSENDGLSASAKRRKRRERQKRKETDAARKRSKASVGLGQAKSGKSRGSNGFVSLRDLAAAKSRNDDSKEEGIDLKSAMLGGASVNVQDGALTNSDLLRRYLARDSDQTRAAQDSTQANLEVPVNAEVTSIDPASLQIRPLNILQPPVPKLEYGLDRVLFNPGVYQLQDSSSRVYNFDPYLQKVMPVVEFDFDSLKQYRTSSQDQALIKLAKKYDKKYIGSTSSMTSSLAHFHYLLSNWRPVNVDMLTFEFATKNKARNFTETNRAPSAIFLRWKNGTYAIDADKEFDSANVLMLLGKSMELLLTLPTSEYERYRKSDPRAVTEEEKTAPESYEYTTMRKFLMRSQLDAYDPRLPGNGTFDLKTRAVVSVRMRSEDYEPMTGYEIYGLHGHWFSYEKEFYDMSRATMLKYMLQARMGRMNGIFVAYHNVKRIFGFQFIPIQDMDRVLHGQTDPCLGNQEFKASLDIMQELFDKATAKFPEQSLRFHFETREPRHTRSRTALYVFAEPMSEEEVDEIQNKQKAKIQEFEDKAMGKCKTPTEGGAASATSAENEPPEKARSHPVVSSDSNADGAFLESNAMSEAQAKASLKPLFHATVIVQSKINGQPIEGERPQGLSSKDKWEIDYVIETHENTEQAWAAYEDCKSRRKHALGKEEDEDGADAESEGKVVGEDKYITLLKRMSANGRLNRERMDKLDAGKEIVRLDMPTFKEQEVIEDVDEGKVEEVDDEEVDDLDDEDIEDVKDEGIDNVDDDVTPNDGSKRKSDA